MNVWLAQWVNSGLGKLGYRIARVTDRNFSLEAALLRLAQRSVEIETVIDVGASDSRWTQTVRPFYPNAFFLLIEANLFHESKLQSYVQRVPMTDFVLAVAGNQEGKIFFDKSDPMGGIASSVAQEGYVQLPMTTVDAEVQRRNLQPPFFLKLDTHGFEIPILEGAIQILEQTTLLLIETYNFQIQPHSLRFHEMCTYLETKGFRPIDIIEPLHRPEDQALWQFDLLFMRTDRQEFQNNTYTS